MYNLYDDNDFFSDSMDGVDIVLTECHIQEREPASQQHMRPARLQLDNGRVLERIASATNDYTDLSRQSIRAAGVHQMMGYSGTSDGAAVITNGWNAQRAYVKMVFEIRMQYSSIVQRVVMNGYTDKYEFIPGYGLTDDTLIWFNDMEEDSHLDNADVQGGRIGIRNQAPIKRGLLRRTLGVSNPLDSNQYALRASDIAGEIRGRSMTARHGGHELNATSRLRNAQQAARSSELMADNYISGVLGGIREVTMDNSLSSIDNDSVFISALRSTLDQKNDGFEYTGIRNRLFSFLQKNSAYGNANQHRGSDYTKLFALDMGTLRKLFPTIDRVICHFELDEYDNHADTASWGGATMMTTTANMVRDAVVAMLSKFDIGQLTFSLTGIGEAYEVRLFNVMFTRPDAGERPNIMDDIERDIGYYIYQRISKDGSIGIELNAEANAGGMLQFELAFDGGTWEHYSAPLYTRQTYAAEITHNPEVVDQAVNDINSMISAYRNSDFDDHGSAFKTDY